MGGGVVKDLNWNDAVSVYVDEIDADHQKPVDLFNRLMHAVEAGESPAYLEAVLEELIIRRPGTFGMKNV